MTFAYPHIFWLFLLLFAPLCLFLFWTWRTKQKLIAQFVQSRLLANLTVGVSQSRQKLRLVLLAATVLFLILALARPQWGESWEEAKQQGLDIVVGIDTSRSMLASDVAPNRLTRAKLAALDLMRLAKNDRLGLVAFAGSAFLQCPLTLDEEAFRQSVEALDVGIIPQGGTAITEAIQTALTAFEKENDNHKVFVLFTDGEDQDSGAEAAAEKAGKAGMKIFTVGVGTASGELIRLTDAQGNTSFLKDESGNAVKSRLDETLLRKIAVNGFYLPLQGAKPMEVLYAKGLAPLPKSDSTTKLVRQLRERFHWPLGVAIVLLVLEMFLPQRKRTTPKTSPKNGMAKVETATVMGVMALMFAVIPARASPSSALHEYEAGNFHSAMDEFKKLSRDKTNDLRLSYNAGTAAYRAKQYDDAQKFLSAATAAPDLKLQEQAYYNLGNTLFAAGEQAEEPDKKQEAWQGSAQNFENSLKLNPQDAEAKNNLEFVKKKLEELKKQQQQKQKQQDKNDQSKDKNQQDKQDQQKNEQNQENKNQDSQKKDSEKKDGQSEKQDSAKSDQEKKEQQQKEAQQKQQAKDEQKKEQERQKAQEQKDGKSPQENQEQQEAAAMALGQMTQEQARQFLDAQKQEDRPLIFAPPKKAEQRNRVFKDW